MPGFPGIQGPKGKIPILNADNQQIMPHRCI